ncbi:cell wall-binding repeat-containing protein, partial [uncultured Mobiluncus sp.]|uniref:cell wall-binding repeat-containing protein n=1 Tax=uncultured Mobiluncus sp. TaxID=293425 RepID=UPI00260E9659
AGMGGVAAPAAVAAPSLPGSIAKLARLGGLDRVQTSLEVAAHQFGDDHGTMNPKRLYVVSAAEGNMVDAATAGMLTDGPIAFVYNNSYVASAVGKFFANAKDNAGFKGINEVVAIGGDGVISDSTLNAVKDAMGLKKTSRLAGKDRYETSVAIADYIYQKSLEKDKWFAGRTDDGSNLGTAYLANGANEHVVDSMVAGTLDNGAILLTQPDGKIPEVVAEFIKKTLPRNFAALGGTGAVADATVNEAWVIKSLANKWETSPGIPKIKMTVDELEWLVNGASETATGIDMSKKTLFGGLDRVVDVAGVNSSAWNNKVSGIKQTISNWFNNEANATANANKAYGGVLNELRALYGDAVMADVNASDAIALDKTERYAVGVNYEGIEKSDTYKKAVKAASDDLEKMWSSVKQDPTLGSVLHNPVAQASQVHPDTAGVLTTADSSANDVPLVAVAAMAKYTLDTDKAWYDAKAKELAAAKGSLRGELDKINFKNELRLGGADRFETAQLIANHWARMYGGEFDTHNIDKLYEAYIANGTRLADSLTAGQLTQGPIMLVRNDTKIPDFTAAVAKNLLCWTNKTHPISVYGVGGTGVLSDEVLQAVVNLISTSSVCEVKGAPKATGLLDATVKAYPTETVSVDMEVAGDKNAPTLTLGDITKSDMKTSVKGTGDEQIAGTANTPKTGSMQFTVGKDVVPGTYYAAVKDANGHEATVTIIVENSFVVTPAEFTGVATDTVTLSAKLNGTPKTYNTDYTCTPSDASVKVSTAGVVSFDAPKMVDGKEVILTCKAGKAEAKVKVIGYTNQIAAAAYTAPTLNNKNATPVANTAKTAGATYSYVVKTDGDNLTVANGGKMSISINPATGDLTVTDADYATGTAKTVVVTVTASKPGLAPKSMDLTITTSR